MRKLLIITCLLSTVYIAFGQKKRKINKEKIPAVAAANVEPKLQIDYRTPGAPLPQLKLVTEDNKIITNADLANDYNLLVMTFNPTCDHCQEETIRLKENIFLFKNSKIVLIAAPVMKPHLEFFENSVKIKEFPTLQVTLDSNDYITKTFTYQTLPQINVYDKDRKLIKTFAGDTPIDSLKPYIQ